ncbi:hypothetical protein [Niabella sp.]|uniref:hypothetical protein n=1 Tax=Niabella sp. TaxID=1962976 RepID=UPI002616C264|nr:hypothetical protein [Niabella sp.]
MIDDLDLDALRKTRRIGYYFRYPLHRNDFHDLKIDNELRGHYTAKPLYGRLTPEGRVDTTAGFNGAIAVLYVPLKAGDPDQATLFITHTTPDVLRLSNGKRNWKKIRAVAVKAIIERLAKEGRGA